MIYTVGVYSVDRHICRCLGSLTLLYGLSTLGTFVDIGDITKLNSAHLNIIYIGFCRVGSFSLFVIWGNCLLLWWFDVIPVFVSDLLSVMAVSLPPLIIILSRWLLEYRLIWCKLSHILLVCLWPHH